MAVNLEQENARLRDEVYSSHSEINKLKAENERLQADLKGTQARLRIEREAQAKQLKRIRNAVADLNDVMEGES